MTVLGDGIDVAIEAPTLPAIELETPSVPTVTLGTPTPISLLVEAPSAPAIEFEIPDDVSALVVPAQGPAGETGHIGPRGPEGPRGLTGPPGSGSGSRVSEYQMPLPATVFDIDHDLGRDPVAIQVFDGDFLCDEYGVFFTVPNEQVRLTFDIPLTALVRLL